MTPAQQLYHKTAAELPDATEGKMFGSLCIKAPNGKAAAMFYDDDMVFKLPEEAVQETMALDGAKLFDPMGDRPMKGWVQLPYSYSDRWKELAEQSLEFVKTLR